MNDTFTEKFHQKRGEIPLALRKDILNRDKRCIVCWRKYDLSIHHFFDGELDNLPYQHPNLTNLVTLCKFCHGKIDACEKGSPFYQIVVNYLKQIQGKGGLKA